MAIGFRATGSWLDSTGNLTTAIPAGTVAGDLMVLFYGTKPFNDVPTINNSWIDAGAATDGTVAAGIDVGSMQARIFYKIHTGTEANPTVTNATNNVSSGVILSFSKDALKNWDLVFGGGGDNTAGTAFSATTSTNINIAANDWIASFITTRSDAGTIGDFTPTASGITFGAFNSQPGIGFVTTGGGDMSARSGYNAAIIGTATTPITIAATLGAAHTGSMFLVRMREVDPPLSESYDPFGMQGFFGL